MKNATHKKVIIWHHEQFLHQWQNVIICMINLFIREISQLGFLTDLQRSHRVADWAYKQAIENEYLVWLGGKEEDICRSVLSFKNIFNCMNHTNS
jgi:hypothetical protein